MKATVVAASCIAILAACSREDRQLREDAFTVSTGRESKSAVNPRSGGDLTGSAAIADYVRQFSANAPGWTATVE
ncbi:MAG: hypothetical protein AAF252_13835, partial [Pseudomonadota bacterium]